MSDPATWLILGGLVSAGGTIYSASKQAEAASANAQMAEDRAKKEREAAEREEDRFRRQGERFMSRQRALYAVSGIRMDEGSALDVMKDSIQEIELDAMAIRAGAEARSRYYLSQARLDRLKGETALISGAIRAGTSLLNDFSEYRWGN
jgi:hypothetical protein